MVLSWSLTELIRIELGLVGISANDLKALAQHYSVTDEERVAELLALSRAAREQSWWSSHRGISRPLGMLIEYENAAYLSRHYQDLVIPGCCRQRTTCARQPANWHQTCLLARWTR